MWDVWDLLAWEKYMRYLSVKRDIRDLSLLREMCEISCYLIILSCYLIRDTCYRRYLIPILKRYRRYLSIERYMWDLSLLREVCEIPFYSAMCEISSFRRNRWDTSLSREIYPISLFQGGYTRSLSIKRNMWDILLFKKDTWYPPT